MKEFLLNLVKSGSGVSSKRFIGAICYILITLGILLLSFINPNFNGLSEIITTLIITTASLLGLTTVENITNKNKDNKKENNE